MSEKTSVMIRYADGQYVDWECDVAYFTDDNYQVLRYIDDGVARTIRIGNNDTIEVVHPERGVK